MAALRRGWALPQQRLRPQVERLHLTLQFVADWPAARLAVWQQALAGLRFEPFDIVLARSERWRTPGGELLVLLPRACPALVALHAATEALARQAGVPAEPRAWRPHVTTLRGVALPPGPLPVHPIRWHVDSVVLVCSEPERQPPRYRVLSRYPAPPDAVGRGRSSGGSR